MEIQFHIFYSTKMQFVAKVDDFGITSDPFNTNIEDAKDYATDFMRRFNLDYVDCIDANTGELLFGAYREN